MERSETETESLRVEQGKRADEERSDESAASMSLGSMIRGPIGRERADSDDNMGSEGADADREAAEERES